MTDIGTKLETRNLCKTFVSRSGTTTEVLDNVNVSVKSGEFVCIVGASGCGKTTFLRIVDGLIEPTDGHILINRRAVTDPGTDRIFVFQSDCLMPWRTAQSNIIFGLEIQGKGKNEADEMVKDFIHLVGLDGFEKCYPHELSGGISLSSLPGICTSR